MGSQRVGHDWVTFTHMSIESIQPSHPVAPFSFCMQSFPASGYFPVSQLFTSGGQSTGASASASVLPMNIWDWLPLGLIDLLAVQGTLKSLLQHHNSKASNKGHQGFAIQDSLKAPWGRDLYFLNYVECKMHHIYIYFFSSVSLDGSYWTKHNLLLVTTSFCHYCSGLTECSGLFPLKHPRLLGSWVF